MGCSGDVFLIKVERLGESFNKTSSGLHAESQMGLIFPFYSQAPFVPWLAGWC